jgi:hypothetical protein
VNEKFDHFISSCFQGKGLEALALARSVQKSIHVPKDAKLIQRFLSRFSSPYKQRAMHDPLQTLIAIFELYWHNTFLANDNGRMPEKLLGQQIRSWMKQHLNVNMATNSLDKTSTRLKLEIERLGYHCITGKILPLWELEIWANQTTVNYSVELPSGTQKVKTFFMKDFLSKGWMAYVTVGRNCPGGWAKEDGLYCNSQKYNPDSEKFLVSFLAHEAQHYSDYRKFPNLGQIDLEYRAKLVEFCLAKRRSRHLFKLFAGQAAKNEKSPHAFANHCVLRDLTNAIFNHEDFRSVADEPKKLSSHRLNASAAQLLDSHSSVLIKRGSGKVRRIIR